MPIYLLKVRHSTLLKVKGSVTLEISFKSRKLSKEFISSRVLIRRYGDKNAKVLAQRMLVLRASRNLQEVSDDKATKFHQLHLD